MPKHILFTFLGRGRYDPKTGYQKTSYEFPDGSVRSTAFFGCCLAEYLRVDEMVIFGTNGSHWSVLVENFAIENDLQNVRLKLIDAEANSCVDQELLDQVTPTIEAGLGLPVSARIIPHGKSDLEQYQILSQINKARPTEPANISIDVTHGYRHLGMIGFLSVFVLERIGDIAVQGLWYGALDMTKDQVAPVVKLDGLVRVHKWIDGLERFDSTGNYATVADLLHEDGVDSPSIKLLEEAAFHEYTNHIAAAKHKLVQFLPTLDEPLDGASGLFQDTLRKRLAWLKQPNLSGHQRKLAENFLDRGDYLRATIFGWESYITKRCEQEGVKLVGESRKQISSGLQEHIKKNYSKGSPVRTAFFSLRDLRNTLAHGGPPTNNRIKSILRDQNRLKKNLRKWFSVLLD